MLIDILELVDSNTIDNLFKSLWELLTINKIIFTEGNLRVWGIQKITSNRHKFTTSDLKDHILWYTNNAYLDLYEWSNIESTIINDYVNDITQKRDIYIKQYNINVPDIKWLITIKYFLSNKKLFLDFINQTDIRESVHGLINIALPYIVYTAAKFDDFVLQKSNVRHIEKSDLVAYCIECLHQDIPLYHTTQQTKYTEWIVTKITEYMIIFFSSHTLEWGDSSEIEWWIKHIRSKSPELEYIDEDTLYDESYKWNIIWPLKSLFTRDLEARNEFSSVLKDIQHEDMNKEINDSLETITPRESTVIQMYFWLNKYHPHSFDEIAIELKLTRERIRQILEKSVRRLKHTSRSKHLRKWLENRVDKNYIDPDTNSKYKLYISKFSSRSSFSDDSIIIRDDYLIDDY
jgi:RNA polymerase sigma factor (sigma-70 family)